MSVYNNIVKNLTLLHGSFTEEFVEQNLSVKYIKPDDVVLEIGGNMGRNALVISSIVNNEKHFVTMEPNLHFYEKLKENRDINKKHFNIENSALSTTPILFYDSLTVSLTNIEEKFPISKDHLINNKNSFNECPIITYLELENKYNLSFNTLVIDCEGAFYYILKDMPYILSKINLIIMENDYENKTHYDFIKTTLLQNNFICVESLPLPGCPWPAPCKDNFYEVWKLNT